MKKYLATIYVNISAEEGSAASKKLELLLKQIPNSYSNGLAEISRKNTSSSIPKEPTK